MNMAYCVDGGLTLLPFFKITNIKTELRMKVLENGKVVGMRTANECFCASTTIKKIFCLLQGYL